MGSNGSAKESSVANANSIRPDRPVSLRSKGETRTRDEREARGAEGLGDKATAGAVWWLETEGSEGQAHEVRRPARGKGIEEPERHILRAGVRAPIVATKPGNAGGAKGCRKVETRCVDWMDRYRR